ncbi:tumor necrosis factor receptor superfamily member 3-like [Ambystoma mexicanum]|uniref:tumor necrosis factor receptor superfamily member 3-like n=1 Tax=Ambystoma mexicanum TaxID=8296 RepID=UPI0037E833DB
MRRRGALQALFLLPLCLSLLGTVSGSPPCATGHEYQPSTVSGGRCCSKCPPGHYMTKRCTPLRDTECRPCREGVAYNPAWNTKYQCEPCRQCHGVLEYRSQCTLATDAICTCRAGLYCATKDCLQCLNTPPEDPGIKRHTAAPSRRPSRQHGAAKECRHLKRRRRRQRRLLRREKPHQGNLPSTF